ncbi:MAG: hypothetical protein EA361_18585 [Bacteroidetes bacterium]|nr:MAG: hypothetical protein EA361_18585 [Bacteroidota bacterium]
MPATTYYLRAYAENMAGVGYGEEVVFETSEVAEFELELAAHPSGAGTLSGAGTYSPGEEIQITAIPEPGYNFMHWSHNGDTLSVWPEFTFTMPGEDVALVANFVHDSIKSTDYWFAIPKVTEGHGWGSKSFGFYFVNGNHPNQIRISMPADLSFEPIEFFLQPHENLNLNLTDQIQQLWTSSPGAMHNRGFHIESMRKVNAFFEVGTQNNPDIFSLKGEKSLGKDFYVPFQNTFPSSNNYNPRPYSAIYIVATEDNTQVTITPTRPAFPGQPANTPFVIQLNKGQTYAVAPDDYPNQGQHPENRLAGTRVQSTKPIAVVMSDDSVAASGCRDLVGDQMVPVSQIGAEYIVMKGRLTLPEYFYVLATEESQTTEVFIDGQSVFSLQAGQQAAFEFSESLHHVETSHPVYLLHMAGFGCEVGGAILPSLENPGQRQIDFTRTRGESFFVNLLVKSGDEDGFTLNGNPLPAASFVPVPGAPGWLAGEFQFSVGEVPVHQTSTMQNSKGTFHMSIINGGNTSGAMYGNFSF